MTFHALCEVGSNCVGQQAESQSDMTARAHSYVRTSLCAAKWTYYRLTVARRQIVRELLWTTNSGLHFSIGEILLKFGSREISPKALSKTNG